jgi:chromosome segregation ATPase
MDKKPNIRDESSSPGRLEVHRQELTRLGDRLDDLQESIMILEKEQMLLQKRISELRAMAEAAKEMYAALFAEQPQGREEIKAEPAQPHTTVRSTEQITLGISEVTRERILSVLDAIRRVSEESQGPAPKDLVRARAGASGIGEEDLDEALGWLRRAGALRESEGRLELI